jgi:hypothetical protein
MPNPIGIMMIFAWSSVGTRAPTGTIKEPRASKPAAQRGRIPARKVAMANSREPRINIGVEMIHIVGMTPRFTSLGTLFNIPRKPVTNGGNSLAN